MTHYILSAEEARLVRGLLIGKVIRLQQDARTAKKAGFPTESNRLSETADEYKELLESLAP